ncbi:MAG: nitrogenase iron-molybdenum cofactor biosynthesis protein NifN [Nitrospirae bacterium]|nr:nitrogenase iron-molybdenum cofactor biosynthesis protein NifN [Nitrospirota bacterium]
MQHNTKDIERVLSDGCRSAVATDTGVATDKVCRARGGESCAFDGAMIVLQPIADSLHLVHGPSACAGNSWQSRGTLSSKGNLYNMGFTTDMGEMDIVYGSEDRLYRAILAAYDRIRLLSCCRTLLPQAIFVYATCVSGIIGEDIDAVCRRAMEVLPVPVIAVNAPGFVGPKNLGNRIAGDTLLEHVIGAGTPPMKTPVDVNLIGEYNIAGDLWHVEPILEAAGIRVLSRITGNATFREITWAHHARLNVLVCSRALINVARQIERRYGIGFVEVSFYGKTQMQMAVNAICDALEKAAGQGINLDLNRSVVQRQAARCEQQLLRYQHLRGKKAVLYTGGVKSWSIVSALMDLGIEVVAVGTKKSTYEDEEKIKAILGNDAPLVEDTTPKNLLSLIRQRQADMLIAGGRNLYLGVKEEIPFVDVNQERHRPYAGFSGLVNLAEDISRVIEFYDRLRGGSTVPKLISPGRVVINKQPDVVINPLKHSPSIGATIALQGIDRAVPVIHGAQGCTFLAKALITRHFREPIALASTRLFAEDVIMSSDDNLVKTVDDLVQRQAPDVIAILSSGLTEVKGDDHKAAIKALQQRHDRTMLVYVATPDFQGGLEDGYRAAIEAVIDFLCLEGRSPSEQDGSPQGRSQVNVIAGHFLTPADFSELREMIESFGLHPVFLPDLSALDGSRPGVSPLAMGGVSLSELRTMPGSVHTLVIGCGLKRCAELLRRQYGVNYTVIKGLSSFGDVDHLVGTLRDLTGREASKSIQRQRRVMVDGMKDAQFYFAGKRVCIALEAGDAVAVSRLLAEMGAEVPLCVIPSNTSGAKDIEAVQIVVGDLFSICSEPLLTAAGGEFDLLISNSHAEDTADRLGVGLYQLGFPLFKFLGVSGRLTCGYRGALSMVNEMANIMSHQRKEV